MVQKKSLPITKNKDFEMGLERERRVTDELGEFSPVWGGVGRVSAGVGRRGVVVCAGKGEREKEEKGREREKGREWEKRGKVFCFNFNFDFFIKKGILGTLGI